MRISDWSSDVCSSDLGYVAIDREPEAASKTVEYAYDDWTIARMAEKMGRKDIADRFYKRAGYWRNSFDAKTGWLRARKTDGSFRTPFDPTAINYGSDYRSEEHTSELQSLMRISYAVFCLNKNTTNL